MNGNSLKNMVEGYYNYLKSLANLSEKEIDDLSTYRLNICNSCSEKDKYLNLCKKCGCFLNLKTKSKNSTCPLNKW